MSFVRILVRNVGLVLLGLVLASGACELALRATHLFGARTAYTEPDPLIGWRFTPEARYWHHKENPRAISGRINRHGWRDHDRTLRKPDGVYRVAVIGDSYVEAMQVELDSTFMSIAERADGPGLEVLNMGRSGMAPAEELLVLERDALAFDPDAVAVFFFPLNDIDDVHARTADTALRPFFHVTTGGELELDVGFSRGRAFRLRRAINPLKQHSALVSLVAERYNLATRARRRGGKSAGAPSIPAALSLCTTRPDSLAASSYALCKRLLKESARLCEKRGIRFALFCIAVAYDEDSISRMREVDPTFDPMFFDRDLRAWADTIRVDFVGLQEPFAQRGGEAAHALQWAHWNYAGHRLVAREFARWLDQAREEE